MILSVFRYSCETFVLGAACAAMLGAEAAAQSSPLRAEDIRREIIGRTIFLAAPITGEFPLNYRPNGVVTGDGEALGIGRLFRPKDSGRWWINGDRLCQQFTTWYDGAAMCFDLQRAGAGKLRWVRDNGETGLARIGG